MRRKTHERIVGDLLRQQARERDEWLRERKDLLDRIMYMADRPWTPPPTPPEATIPPVEWPQLPEDLVEDLNPS